VDALGKMEGDVRYAEIGNHEMDRISSC
jgi:hypothetical protein